MNNYKEYYPRPLLRRNSFFSLDGKWTLNENPIEVPFPKESKLSGYEKKDKEMLYEKVFSLPENFVKDKDKVMLNFGAVDQKCEVYLNSNHILSHEGGYLPFKVDITEYLLEENILRVRCIDDLDPIYPYGKQTSYPHGMWYTPVSGIWQSVFIESYPKDGIDDLAIETGKDYLKLNIDSSSSSFTVSFSLEGHPYRETFTSKEIFIDLSKENVHLWDIDDPYLYDLRIETRDDVIKSYFALREISVKEVNGYKRLFLNDKPLFINGLLDQGYFQNGIFLPDDPLDYQKEIESLKKMGYNLLRKHIKVEPEAFYYYCDRAGMLVMQDMVNSGKYSFIKDTVFPTIGLKKKNDEVKDQKRYNFFINHSKETILHLKSHPCIIAYTIYNEGWGQQDASRAYDTLKELDEKRLFDSASGWFTTERSDFASEHIYFRNKVLKNSDRSKLLLLSECGGYTRGIPGHLYNPKKKYGYGKADSLEALTDKIIEMHEKMTIPSIRNGLVGVIMTQVSDVEEEINGLFTYDREVLKVDPVKIKEINDRLVEIYKKEIA